jgi:hypothetical protein
MFGSSDFVPFENKIRRARNFVRIESNVGTPRETAGTGGRAWKQRSKLVKRTYSVESTEQVENLDLLAQ